MKERSWWPQQLLIGWLNLVLTAPTIYLFIGLPLVMRQHGWSGTEIGMMQMTGLPALFKFALALPVDHWRLGRASYRNWAVVLGVGYAATLLLLAAHDLRDTPHALLFLLAMLVSLFGTWADMPINALAIHILPESERLRAGAIRSTATSLGAIVGGGLMLLLNARLGWAWTFNVLALGMLSGVVLMPLLKVHGAGEMAPGSNSSARVRVRQSLAWFSLPSHRSWTVLLVLYFPLIGAVWVYLKPLMLDQGFAPERIAMIVGVGGGVVAAIASMAGSYVSRRRGGRVALPLFAACNLLALGMLAGATILNFGATAMVAAAMIVALMMGASGGLIFGLMMYHVRPGFAAMDYGIQSSLFVVGRTVLPILAGILLDHLGYPGMFGFLLVGSALVLVLLLAEYRGSRFTPGVGTRREPPNALSGEPGIGASAARLKQ